MVNKRFTVWLIIIIIIIISSNKYQVYRTAATQI